MGLRKIFAALLLIGCLATPSAVSANPLMLVSGQLSNSLAMLIQAGSLCVTYSYDTNGNRLTQTNAAIGAGATAWGAGTYGCFMWSA